MLLAVAMEINDAEVRVNHDVATAGGGCHQVMRANAKEANDALHGGRCTHGRKKVLHTTMMEERENCMRR